MVLWGHSLYEVDFFDVYVILQCIFKYSKEMVKRCVVRGELIGSLGGRSEFRDQKVNALNTDLGPVCRDCHPAYEKAGHVYDTEGWFAGVKRGKFLSEMLRNPEFVTTAIRDHLASVYRHILESWDDVESWHGLVRDLRRYLVGVLKVDDYAQGEEFGYGGLDLKRALACMNEEDRTMKFFRGIAMAVSDLEREHEGPIVVVDAGTGPLPIFAILVAVLSKTANITAIEINPASYRFASEVLQRFGLSERIKLVLADATRYQHDQPVDLLISETMYAGLIEEPLLQILANFNSQMAKGGVIIPTWFSVKAGLVSSDFRPNSQRQDFPFEHGLIEVSRFTRDSLGQQVSFHLPVGVNEPGDFRLALASDVGVYGDITVAGSDSVISAPVIVGSSGIKLDAGVDGLDVSYLAGTRGDDISSVARKKMN